MVNEVIAPPNMTTVGNYRLIGHLADGVYPAWLAAPEDNDETLVVVKVLKRELTENEDLANRFKREAQITQAINHANVVNCIDSGIDRTGTLLFSLNFRRWW